MKHSAALAFTALATLFGCAAIRVGATTSDSNSTAPQDGGDESSTAPSTEDAATTNNNTVNAGYGPPNGACTLTVSSESYHGATSDGDAFASYDTTNGLGFACEYAVNQGYIYYQVAVGASTTPGTYQTTQGYLEEECGDDCTPIAGDLDCSITITQIDVKNRGGVQASFSCNGTANDESDLTVNGTLSLSPPSPSPPPPTDIDAGPPTCTMTITGDYVADLSGEGNNYECYAVLNGISYSITPGVGYGALSLSGQTWCENCEDAFTTTTGCTDDVIVDNGVGGSYVASFACPLLNGPDGTSVAVTGTINGIHERPPD